MNASEKSPSPPRLGGQTKLVNLEHQPMLALMFAALLGLILDRCFAMTAYQWTTASAGLMVVLLICWRIERNTMVASLAFCVCFAGLYHHLRDHDYRQDNIARWVSDQWQPAIVEGIVISAVERRPDILVQQRRADGVPVWQSIFEIEVASIRSGLENRIASGRARVVVAGVVANLLRGDRVRLTCQTQRVQAPTNPGELDLQKVYRARRQLVRIYAKSPESVIVNEAGGLSLYRLIDWCGNRGQRALNRNIDEAVVPLAEAIVLGRRQAVDREMRDRLLETGTVHLLAVSGLHVGIIATAIMSIALLFRVPTTARLAIVIAVCLAYMLLTGARPPVVRAATLISLFLFGRLLGYRIDPLNTLATAGFLLFVIDPLSLTQIGTHLSFLAVATIVLASRVPDPPAEADAIEEMLNTRWHRFMMKCKNVARIVVRYVVMSFWISAIALPLVWYYFHVISPISILANVLLWIPLSLALITGLLSATLGAIWTPLGWLPGKLSQLALQLIVWIIDRLAVIELGHFWLPSPPFWVVLVYYVIVIALPFAVKKTWRRPALCAAMIAWVGIAVGLATRTRNEDAFVATFIDVGHGTSILMQLPSGENWLYDAGRLGDPGFARWPIEAVLWSEGIYRIDRLIISHADSDHYNAVEGLLERFRIAEIATSSELFDSPEAGIVKLKATLECRGIPLRSVCAGETLCNDELCLTEVLHPPSAHVKGSDNANSIVLKVKAFGKTLLLPGDLEQPGMASLLSSPPCDKGGVLMAPHHGSLSQDLLPILTWANPATVIASGGERAANQRVFKELGETGAEVFVTARHGAIRVTFSREGTRVQSWLEQPW